MLPKFEVGTISFKPAVFAAGFLHFEAGMTKDCDRPRPSPTDRAKQLTKPFADDDALDRWAARMVAAADEFQKNKRPDPLGGFLMR